MYSKEYGHTMGPYVVADREKSGHFTKVPASPRSVLKDKDEPHFHAKGRRNAAGRDRAIGKHL